MNILDLVIDSIGLFISALVLRHESVLPFSDEKKHSFWMTVWGIMTLLFAACIVHDVWVFFV